MICPDEETGQKGYKVTTGAPEAPNIDHPTPNALASGLNLELRGQIAEDRITDGDYFGAREATIFSKRGSPRSGSQ